MREEGGPRGYLTRRTGSHDDRDQVLDPDATRRARRCLSLCGGHATANLSDMIPMLIIHYSTLQSTYAILPVLQDTHYKICVSGAGRRTV